MNTSANFELELTRICDAYRRRAATIPADRYSLQNLATLCSMQERQRTTLIMLRQHGPSDLANGRILDLGCGTGADIRDFVAWGAQPANITGIDLLPERITRARELCPPGVTLVCGSAHQTQFADQSFDIVGMSTVLTSVLDNQMRFQIAREALRVLRPGGSVLWYDFRVDNPWNREVRGVCARELRTLFPGCDIYLKRTTLAPPLGRRVGTHSALLYFALAALKVFSTHYVGLFRKHYL